MFLNDDIAFEVLNRLHNEYSHLEGIPDRGMTQMNSAEIKKSARLILLKVSEKNPSQFCGLCESIEVDSNLAIENLK